MESASSHLDLLDVLNEKQLPYIKEGGSFDSYQFKRTCVLDSLLAAFHTTFMKYPNVKAYLNSDKQFRDLMALLSAKKYVKAKDLCVPKLKHVKVDDTRKEKDFYGSVYDHFLLFDKLVYETISNPKPLKDSLIYKETLSFVKALGDPADPTLILGCCSTPKPLLHVEDEKKRIFALQFLLIGKNDHMTMCFQSYENKWHLYDNDTTKPPFESFDLERLKDLNDICLAGYVNITQAQGYKLAVPETGEAAGAKPFYSGASSSIHLDPRQSVEDLCRASSDSVAIPETGEGLGPKPLYQNQPYSPTFSNQEQLVEDIEMPSCSSSDSDGEAVPETGEAAGAEPIYSGASSSIHLDPGQSVEDLCCASSDCVAIPETGEGLGPKPFNRNQPYSPTFSNQEQLVEDIEMPSCSSSDSD